MLVLQQIRKRYGAQKEALGLSLSIDAGELVFITGHSGAGKSTLLKLISAQEKPSSGSIECLGWDLNKLKRSKLHLYRRQLGIVGQAPMLLWDETVAMNVALPLLVSHASPSIIENRTRAALDKVGLLSKMDALPGSLSTGEQQRVSIAMAIAHRPSLIVADEPTGNLDPQLARNIMELFVRFANFGVTIIIATHDLGLINQLVVPYKLIELSQGQIVQQKNVNQSKKGASYVKPSD